MSLKIVVVYNVLAVEISMRILMGSIVLKTDQRMTFNFKLLPIACCWLEEINIVGFGYQQLLSF